MSFLSFSAIPVSRGRRVGQFSRPRSPPAAGRFRHRCQVQAAHVESGQIRAAARCQRHGSASTSAAPKELYSAVVQSITCCDAFAARGRARAEEKLPALLTDIQDIAKGFSQTDPQFRNRRLYTRLTAEGLHRQLIEQKGYKTAELPTPRTLRTKLNDLGFHLTKVAKCKPKKRSNRPMPSLPS